MRKISKEQSNYDDYERDIVESMSIENFETQVSGKVEDLPSSQEQRQKPEEIRTKWNIIFELLDISSIRDM